MPQSLAEMAAEESARGLRGRRPEQRPRRTRRQTARLIGTIPLFQGFATRHLVELAKASDEVDFGPRARVVEEGQLGEALFVVISGSGRVLRAGRKVGEVVPGDFFGELSAIDGGPRTATVEAETPMRVLRLFRHTLVDLLQREPKVAARLLEGMAARLRRAGPGVD